MMDVFHCQVFEKEVEAQCRAEGSSKTVEFHGIIKEIVIEDFGKHGQEFHINSATFENGIYIGALAVKLSRQFTHTHPTFIKDGFH